MHAPRVGIARSGMGDTYVLSIPGLTPQAGHIPVYENLSYESPIQRVITPDGRTLDSPSVVNFDLTGGYAVTEGYKPGTEGYAYVDTTGAGGVMDESGAARPCHRTFGICDGYLIVAALGLLVLAWGSRR